ncbi:Ascofuranone/ascochlorin biosynthesis clusters transcription regulator [Paramyrothecium foliicola]|nr:Ascofuranone/ascochlorin biosynthesis clusters transcription regulator [Paramyrothecium foliicola]
MAVEKPLRFACDRCHAQKLRCARLLDEKSRPDDPCSRCRKADVPCVVSERGKVGRPAKANKRKAGAVASAFVEAPDRLHQPHASIEITNTIPVLGVDADASALKNTPTPKSRDEPMFFDHDETFYVADQMTLTPKNLIHDAVMSDDSNDADTNAWASQGAWSDTTSSIGNGNNALSDTVAYQQMASDFPAHLDMPLFRFTSGTSDILDLHGDLLYLDGNAEANQAPIFPSSLHPEMELPSLDFGSEQGSSSPASPANFSSASNFQQLSRLNAKILQSSENYGIGNSPEFSTLCINQIIKDIVEFSGELISIARQVLPHLNGTRLASTPPSYPGFGVSGKIRKPTSSFGSPTRMSPSISDSRFFEPETRGSGVPESAAIFLLLGCYSQLLQTFELAVDCLYQKHSRPEHSDLNFLENPDTLDSLLKASLAIHTVTYLLNCVHKAFSSTESDFSDDINMAHAGNEPVDLTAWKGFFWGNREGDAKDGLLTQAFMEIHDRELNVLRKAQHLRQVISRFHI